MARNYFKVNLERGLVGMHVKRGTDLNSPEWLQEMKRKTARIYSMPPRPVDELSLVFFDDRSLEDTARAWDEALKRSGNNYRRIHIYRLAPVHGPWSVALEIGEFYPSPTSVAA